MKNEQEKGRALAMANEAKDRLYEVVGKLEELGYSRKAKSGMSLIYAIEQWQNRR
jgi:hypothetical protein